MWRRVDLVRTDAAEEHVASIFIVEKNPRARKVSSGLDRTDVSEERVASVIRIA
jgi:hypothetical protein